MAFGLLTINRTKVLIGIAIIGIIFIFPCICQNAQAQTGTTFSPADKFSIPAYNGSFSFAVNGTYSKATFENNAWVFLNLSLEGSQTLKNFTISTQNSNLTIISYRVTNNTGFQSLRLRYTAEGNGKQVLNLGLGPEPRGLNPNADWTVTVNNSILAEGTGWSISNNGTMTINNANGNVSITRYNYFGFGNGVLSSNLPFYEQHSIAVTVAVAVAAIVAVAVAIKVITGRHLREREIAKNLGQSAAFNIN